MAALLMWANTETGVLFRVERIAETCPSHGVLCRCNVVQAAGVRHQSGSQRRKFAPDKIRVDTTSCLDYKWDSKGVVSNG
jgi:hypothetical protein